MAQVLLPLKCLFHSSGGGKPEMECEQGGAPCGGFRGASFLLLPASGGEASLGLWPHPTNLCLCCHMAPPLCLCLLFGISHRYSLALPGPLAVAGVSEPRASAPLSPRPPAPPSSSLLSRGDFRRRKNPLSGSGSAVTITITKRHVYITHG